MIGRRRMGRMVVLVALFLAASVAVLRSRIHASLNSDGYLPRLHAVDLAHLQDQILRIEAAAVLEVCGSRRDAAPVLNPIIGLEDPALPPEVVPWWAQPDVKAALHPAGSKWWDQEVPRGDLQVTRELLDYDHWTLPEPKPALFPTMAHWEVPLANVYSLQTLAKLRLLEGLHTAAMLPALAEVRHMASLVACGTHVTDKLVALAILSSETEAYDQAVERSLIRANEWQPAPQSLINEMRQVTWSFLAIYAGMVEPGLERPEPPAWLRCAVLQDGLLHASSIHSFVGQRLPGEYDHMARYERLYADAQAATGCRLQMGLDYYRHPEWNTADLSDSGFPTGWRWPYVRDLTAFVVVVRLPGILQWKGGSPILREKDRD